jgi:hypothetical protein
MSHLCQVSLEIERPFAMFARPDTGSTPVSHPLAHGFFTSKRLYNTLSNTLGVA